MADLAYGIIIGCFDPSSCVSHVTTLSSNKKNEMAFPVTKVRWMLTIEHLSQQWILLVYLK